LLSDFIRLSKKLWSIAEDPGVKDDAVGVEAPRPALVGVVGRPAAGSIPIPGGEG